jgi:hypothetical protein
MLLTPLALWNLATSREPRSRVPSAFFLAGIAVQGFVVLRAVVLDTDPTLAQYPLRWSESNALELPGLYGLRVVAALLTGDRLVDDAWRAMGWGFVVAVLIAVLATIVYRAILSKGATRVWALVTLMYSLLFFVLPVGIRGTDHLAPVDMTVVFNGNRYVLVPMWLLVTAALILVEDPTGWKVARWLKPAMTLLLLALVAANYSIVTFRSGGPRWSDALAFARRRCAREGTSAVRIPITPAIQPPGWAVATPCQRLVKG